MKLLKTIELVDSSIENESIQRLVRNFNKLFSKYRSKKDRSLFLFVPESKEYIEMKEFKRKVYDELGTEQIYINFVEDELLVFESFDYENAKAYILNFKHYIEDGYNSIDTSVWFKSCCNQYYSKNHFFVKLYVEQISNLNISNKGIRKLKCCGYTGTDSLIISLELKEVLRENGIDTTDLRPVETRAGEVNSYQIFPQNTLDPLSVLHNWKEVIACDNCGAKVYIDSDNEPYYMCSNTNLCDFNQTFEKFGSFSRPLIVINRRVFDILSQFCEIENFIPILN